MTRRARFAALGVGLVAATGVYAQCDRDAKDRPDRGGKVEWRQDVEAGFADAARTGEPILVYFTADW